MRYPARVAMHPDDRLPITATTRFRDYILTPYEPAAPRSADSLHPASLLRHLLRQHGMLEAVWPICETLRATLGEDETVWGFKLGPAGPSLELYFYNFGETPPDNPKSTSALAAILAPHLDFAHLADEAQRYFMTSFEVTAEAARRRDGGAFRIYLHSGDEAREACGFSYRIEETPILENHYWFYRAAEPRDLADAVRRVVKSPRSGAKPCWSTLLPKDLRDAFTICVAVKPRADGLYYSRIRTEQLARFLARHRPALAEPLVAHARAFSPIRWDLGFDFAAPSKRAARIAIDKIGIHAVL